MVDRQAVGDLALAILIALPLAALAKSQPSLQHQVASQPSVAVATADRSPPGRISLLS
jgi:hypothetical protein